MKAGKKDGAAEGLKNGKSPNGTYQLIAERFWNPFLGRWVVATNRYSLKLTVEAAGGVRLQWNMPGRTKVYEFKCSKTATWKVLRGTGAMELEWKNIGSLEVTTQQWLGRGKPTKHACLNVSNFKIWIPTDRLPDNWDPTADTRQTHSAAHFTAAGLDPIPRKRTVKSPVSIRSELGPKK